VPPAPVRCIDTRFDKLQDGLSGALLLAIEQRLARGEQSLVFLNRRGYAPVLACAACGWTSHCHRCAANLVLHLADRCLRCHHCGFEARVPKACPTCGNQDLSAFGRGTQRLEAVLAERFPQARVLRVDRDSARSRKQWEACWRDHPWRRGRHPGRHPDAGQGPRFPEAHAGRRDRSRRRAVRRRLARARSASSRS
jgi:primosomal protein N'